jgi:hypothetical protein
MIKFNNFGIHQLPVACRMSISHCRQQARPVAILFSLQALYVAGLVVPFSLDVSAGFSAISFSFCSK